VKNSFNSYPLGRIAQAGATASVHDDAYFHKSCARVVAGSVASLNIKRARACAAV
jgi:histidinol-phosphate aminotransferase